MPAGPLASVLICNRQRMGIARPGMVDRGRPAHLLYIFLDDH